MAESSQTAKKRRVSVPPSEVKQWDTVPTKQKLELLPDRLRGYAGSLCGLGRRLTPCETFKLLLPPSVLRSMGGPEADVEGMYRYFGTLAYMHGLFCDEIGDGQMDNLERTKYVEMRRGLMANGLGDGEVFGFDKFKRLQRQYLFSVDLARGVLSSHWASVIVQFGETVALDEKMRKFLGDTPFRKFCPNKPERIGHWTTQLCCMLEGVNLPFCFGMFPWTASACSEIEISLPEVWVWAEKLVANRMSRPIIISDGYYMSNSVLDHLLKNNILFISALNTQRFAPLTKKASSHVHAMGETCVLRRNHEHLFMVHHWDMRRDIGRKYVISNAFRVSISAEPQDGPHHIYLAYNLSFSMCDLFNRKLFKFKYPFRRFGWEANFDSMFVATLFINAWSVWHQSNIGLERYKTLRVFCRELGMQLLRDPTILHCHLF